MRTEPLFAGTPERPPQQNQCRAGMICPSGAAACFAVARLDCP
jgi:hypothetical protein